MVLGFSQLIKFRYRDLSCCLDTVYFGCRPTLSWHKFLQSHLTALPWPQTMRRQPGFIHLQGLSHLPAIPWPKTFSRQPGLSHLDSFVWTPKLSAICRDFYLDQKLPAVYRDFAKTHASACRWRQLIKPPGRYQKCAGTQTNSATRIASNKKHHDKRHIHHL
jgi:hypothetical protein